MTYTRKSRRIDGGNNTSFMTYDGSVISTHTASFQGSETTFSEGHSWPRRKGAELRDIGGPYLNQKRAIYSTPCDLGDSLGMKYGGVVRQYHNLKIYPGGIGNRDYDATSYRSVPSVSQMNAYGATGIARASPVRTQLGLGQFIGELRDIPRLPHKILEMRNGLKVFKSLGNQYLNYEFGWKPFLKDLRGTIKAAVDSEKHIRQLLRDNGKVVRRKVTIAKDSRITSQAILSNFAIGYPAVEGEFIDTYGKLAWSEWETNRTTFSGAFKYYLDYRHGMPMSPKLHRQLMTILYGVDISPHTAWSLLPWTWLTDWFTNVGDNIANMDMIQNDSLTIVYGYATDYKQTMDLYSLQGTVLGGRAVNATQIVIDEYTGRTKSTPYGFGLDPANFSIRQVAILAALGLSRSKPLAFR